MTGGIFDRLYSMFSSLLIWYIQDYKDLLYKSLVNWIWYFGNSFRHYHQFWMISGNNSGHFWTFLTLAGQFENGHISNYLLLKKSTILEYFWPLWGHNWKGHKFRTLLGNKCSLWTLWGQKLLKIVLTVQHYYWFRPLQYQYLAKNLN